MQKDEKESFAALFEAQKGAMRRRHFGIGDELDVTVVQIGKDAVFVELDGKQEGFIESKELLGADGKLTVNVGSKLSGRVVEKGGRAGAMRLSPVLVSAPETEEGAETAIVAAGPVVVGAKIKGPVVGIESYGVFVQIGQTPRDKSRAQRGLVPHTELGIARGADPRRHFQVGQEIEAKVVAIDDEGKIRLSIVALGADEEHKAFQAFEQKAKKAEGSQFGTLGDLLATGRKRPKKG